jgi:hypothetical protein
MTLLDMKGMAALYTEKHYSHDKMRWITIMGKSLSEHVAMEPNHITRNNMR